MPHLSPVFGRLFEGRPARIGDLWRHKAGRRTVVTAGVVLGHVLVLWLLIAGHDHPSPSSPDSGAPIGLDLVGTAPQSAPLTAAKSAVAQSAVAKSAKAQPKPPVVVKLDAIAATSAPQADPVLTDVAYSLPEVTTTDSPPVLSDADAQALSQFQPASAQIGMGPACNLTPAVVRDFSQNPVVRQGVSELPAVEKSVANAVQIWDGAWPQETLSGGKALLRAVLAREIAAAPAGCLKQVNNGPVFFMVPDGAVTTIVAVGSGQWTWGQLVE